LNCRIWEWNLLLANDIWRSELISSFFILAHNFLMYFQPIDLKSRALFVVEKSRAMLVIKKSRDLLAKIYIFRFHSSSMIHFNYIMMPNTSNKGKKKKEPRTTENSTLCQLSIIGLLFENYWLGHREKNKQGNLNSRLYGSQMYQQNTCVFEFCCDQIFFWQSRLIRWRIVFDFHIMHTVWCPLLLILLVLLLFEYCDIR
jgi:hypothetical protein